MLVPTAVFWDIGGVILTMESVQAGHRAFVEQLIATHGDGQADDHSIEDGLTTWRATLSEYFGATEGAEYRPAREGYRQAVQAILGTDDVPWESLYRAVTAEHCEPNPGAVETINRIAPEPLHQGVISDVDEEEGHAILEELDVRDAMDSVTTSGGVGWKKPDERIFQTALDRAGVEAASAVMIGDRYSHDMEGGHRMGMTTISYGAGDGPAVDYQIDHLTDVLDIVGVDE